MEKSLQKFEQKYYLLRKNEEALVVSASFRQYAIERTKAFPFEIVSLEKYGIDIQLKEIIGFQKIPSPTPSEQQRREQRWREDEKKEEELREKIAGWREINPVEYEKFFFEELQKCNYGGSESAIKALARSSANVRISKLLGI